MTGNVNLLRPPGVSSKSNPFIGHPIIVSMANRAEILCGDMRLMAHEPATADSLPQPRWDFMIWCNRYARALAKHNPEHSLAISMSVPLIALAVLSSRNATRAGFADYLNIADEEDPDVDKFIYALKVRQDTNSDETIEEITQRFKRE